MIQSEERFGGGQPRSLKAKVSRKKKGRSTARSSNWVATRSKSTAQQRGGGHPERNGRARKGGNQSRSPVHRGLPHNQDEYYQRHQHPGVSSPKKIVRTYAPENLASAALPQQIAAIEYQARQWSQLTHGVPLYPNGTMQQIPSGAMQQIPFYHAAERHHQWVLQQQQQQHQNRQQQRQQGALLRTASPSTTAATRSQPLYAPPARRGQNPTAVPFRPQIQQRPRRPSPPPPSVPASSPTLRSVPVAASAPVFATEVGGGAADAEVAALNSAAAVGAHDDKTHGDEKEMETQGKGDSTVSKWRARTRRAMSAPPQDHIPLPEWDFDDEYVNGRGSSGAEGGSSSAEGEASPTQFVTGKHRQISAGSVSASASAAADLPVFRTGRHQRVTKTIKLMRSKSAEYLSHSPDTRNRMSALGMKLFSTALKHKALESTTAAAIAAVGNALGDGEADRRRRGSSDPPAPVTAAPATASMQPAHSTSTPSIGEGGESPEGFMRSQDELQRLINERLSNRKPVRDLAEQHRGRSAALGSSPRSGGSVSPERRVMPVLQLDTSGVNPNYEVTRQTRYNTEWALPSHQKVMFNYTAKNIPKTPAPAPAPATVSLDAGSEGISTNSESPFQPPQAQMVKDCDTDDEAELVRTLANARTPGGTFLFPAENFDSVFTPGLDETRTGSLGTRPDDQILGYGARPLRKRFSSRPITPLGVTEQQKERERHKESLSSLLAYGHSAASVRW